MITAIRRRSSLSHTAYFVNMAIWGWSVQLLAYLAARLLLPGLAYDIPAGRTAVGILAGALSLVVGILNAACMTY